MFDAAVSEQSMRSDSLVDSLFKVIIGLLHSHTFFFFFTIFKITDYVFRAVSGS